MAGLCKIFHNLSFHVVLSTFYFSCSLYYFYLVHYGVAYSVFISFQKLLLVAVLKLFVTPSH